MNKYIVISVVVTIFAIMIGAFMMRMVSQQHEPNRNENRHVETTQQGVVKEAEDNSRRWRMTKIIVLAGCAVSLAGMLVQLVRDKQKKYLLSSPVKKAASAFTALIAFLVFVAFFPPTGNILVLMLHDQSGISQLILSILLLGLVIDYMQYLFLKREFEAFHAIYEMAHVDREMDDSRKLAICLDQSARGVLKRKWQAFQLITTKQLGGDFNIAASFANNREYLKESKIAFIIKILPLLGMVGTVLGFVVAVVGMQQAASHMADFSSFKGNMLDALGGMKRAFMTTLAGMVAMIIQMFINTIIMECRNHVLLLEDEFLYLHIFLPSQKERKPTKQ